MVETETKISEGEIYIQEFFESTGIKYEFNKKIDFLKGDIKSYRYADFYLPKYKIYVEFFGQWNVNEDQKVRYREKKKIYAENNIPCVYIYPENLGLLEYLFNYRTMKELKDKGMKKELFRFRFILIMKRNTYLPFKILFEFLAIISTLIFSDINPQFNIPIYLVCSYLIVWDVFTFYFEYRKLEKKKFHNI